MNYTNTHITDYLPLTASINLPDTRENLDGRTLMLGLNDLWTLGNTSNPWIANSYFQYRADPQRTSPSHPQSGIPNNLFNLLTPTPAATNLETWVRPLLARVITLFLSTKSTSPLAPISANNSAATISNSAGISRTQRSMAQSPTTFSHSFSPP